MTMYHMLINTKLANFFYFPFFKLKQNKSFFKGFTQIHSQTCTPVAGWPTVGQHERQPGSHKDPAHGPCSEKRVRLGL